MENYTHISLKERMRMKCLLDKQYSIASIAARLGRHRSTIYRELARNNKGNKYYPYRANQLAVDRHRRPCLKIRYDTGLYYYVLNRLKQGWSPEQISGRLKREKKPYYVCHETIYHYIYKRRNRGLYYLLARKKPKRGKRYGRKVGSGKFAGIRLISERAKEVDTRRTFGHWEWGYYWFYQLKI